MPKASLLRVSLLTPEERAERTRIICVRVPSSWHLELGQDGSYCDKILPRLAQAVRRIRQKKAAKAARLRRLAERQKAA
jgi:hypothetical protein